MTIPAPSTRAIDLRREPVDEVVARVEDALQTRLDRAGVVRKRRTIGARSERGTWVRIERRPFARIGAQGWNDAECAALLAGVTQPTWWSAVSWRDDADGVMWRADETDLLPGTPVMSGGVLGEAPELPGEWWETLNSSLDALADVHTTRVATPDTVVITQAHVSEVIWAAFSGAPAVVLGDWRPAHADLNWANVTGPRFCLFDWEDWGMAPRGLDAASLWAQSLAVPEVAERVQTERRRDLESRDGKVMALFACARIAGPYAHPEDPRLHPARLAAEQMLEELQRG
jgi:hypothetical protein